MEFVALFYTALILAAGLIIGMVISSNGNMSGKRDSTDNPDGTVSGLKLYTDHATGVQYLGASEGLTPRLDIFGDLYSDAKVHEIRVLDIEEIDE